MTKTTNIEIDPVIEFTNYAQTDKFKFTLTGNSRVQDTDFVVFITNAFSSPGEHVIEGNTILIEALD